MRRWFENNQQNISFTVMALLPTIGEHIIEGMDVEGLTNELQEKTRASKLLQNSRPISPESQPRSQTPADTDARSDMESSIVSSVPGVSTTLGDSTQSWVDGFSLRSSRENLSGEGDPNSVRSSMIESITTTSESSQAGSSSSAVRRYPGHAIQRLTVLQQTETSTLPSKSKAELWREIKILSKCSRSTAALKGLIISVQHSHVH